MTELNTQPQKQFKVLLIGDDCQDVYQYGHVDRISPEAPVPVFLVGERIVKPGMAGNVRENLINLGCVVEYFFAHTSIKTRFIDKHSGQQMIRIDDDSISQPLTELNSPKDEFDAIVISDYNKGTVSYELVETLREKYMCPIFVDTKKTDLKRFDGCIVKINAREYIESKTYCKDLIVTYGAQGAVYKDKNYPARKIDVVDVTGAGDTFLAALTYKYLNTKDFDKSIAFAIQASEITVTHMGVYAPTLEELK